MIKCSVCGYENENNNRFCVNCGAKLEIKETESAKEPVNLKPKQEKKAKKERKTIKPISIPWKKACIVLVAVGLVLGLITFLQNRSITVEHFFFRQSAFLRGSYIYETQVMAIVTPTRNTSKIKLIAHCGETGEEFVLTDDGMGADTLANDGVFYGTAVLHFSDMDQLMFILQAEPEGVLKTDNNTLVRFYETAEYELELKRIEFLKEELDKMASRFTYNEKESETVNAENYISVANNIQQYLKDQVKSGVIDSFEWHAPFFSIYFPLGGYVYEFNNFDNTKLSSGNHDIVNNSNENVIEDGEERKEELSMLLMYPFAKEQLDPSGYQRAADLVVNSGLGYSKTEKTAQEVTIRLFKSLQDYRVIAINTHGGTNLRSGSFFYIGTVDSKIPEEDYVNRRMLKSSRGHVLLTPDFFEYYYNDGELNDCLIYLGACNSLENTRLAKLLVRKGANAVLTYNGMADIAYDAEMFEALMSHLVQSDKQGTTITIKKALEAAIKDNKDSQAENSHLKEFWGRAISDNKSDLVLYQSSEMSDFRLNKAEKEIRGKVAGSIVKENDNQIIPGASITIKGKKGFVSTVRSKSNGRYSRKLPAGEYEITVSAKGYATSTQKVTVKANDKIACDFKLTFDPEIKEFFDNFLSYTVNIEDIFEIYYGDGVYSIQALKDLYARLHKLQPSVYKHKEIYNLNTKSEYHLSVPDYKAATSDRNVADWLDYSRRYDRNDVQAVLDKIYGKGMMPIEHYFLNRCFITSDGYLLIPDYGSDDFYAGAIGYKVRDIEVNGDYVLVKCNIIEVGPAYVEDELSETYVPKMGTYNVYDAASYELLEEGENEQLKSIDDYRSFAINYEPDLSQLVTVELYLFYMDDGIHIIPV